MNKSLKGKKILITAGPTREHIDPVRYISNESSGKMGYALATAAAQMGAKVTLISGPTSLKRPGRVEFIPVISAMEMYKATTAKVKRADIIICAAAVSDFRPKKLSKNKIKKSKLRATNYELRLDLAENPDILKALGKAKKPHQLLIGFALETEALEENAREKLNGKNCDFIVANAYKNINSDLASVILLGRNGWKRVFGKMNKGLLARSLLSTISAPKTIPR